MIELITNKNLKTSKKFFQIKYILLSAQYYSNLVF